MSMPRRCPNCYRTEDIRVNFGDNREAEAAFHQRKWCDCGYSSPEEMMRDQVLGFDDPKWVPIAKHFLNRYHRELRSGRLKTKNDQVRYFLRGLKSSLDNHFISATLTRNVDQNTLRSTIPLSKKPPSKTDIFEKCDDLSDLITLEHGLTRENESLRKENDALVKKSNQKNRIIGALVLMLVIAGVLAIV